MNSWKLVIQNLLYYRWKNLTVILGLSVSVAVLTGAFIVGDSVSHNLRRIVELRLGGVNYALITGERFVTQQLAESLEKELNAIASPVFVSEGMAVSDGGTFRANKIQILGIMPSFDDVMGIDTFFARLPDNEAIISQNLAEHLNLDQGDEFILRIKKASLIPLNAPFVSDEEFVVSTRLKVSAIAGDEQGGRFNLRISQTSPYNVFVSLSMVNRLMELNEKANLILFSTGSALGKDEVYAAIEKTWTITDAGLIPREVPLTGKFEIISERVFLDNPVIKAFKALPFKGEFILTYFVNSLSSIKYSLKKPIDQPVSAGHPDINRTHHSETLYHSLSTPYSFVSTLPDSVISHGEMIVNEWLAEDLNIKPGDSVLMKYYVVGPLRRLAEVEEVFVVKEVVPVTASFADKYLMPDIPGLSDAGNCRDWDTGIPIDLGRIRDKDEKYWSDFKGTPKAFISMSLAKELWENMYGSFTSVRFPKGKTQPEIISSQLIKHIDPVSIGFRVVAVKDDSIHAAGEGVDFSRLFLGLSFFVLLSALILSVLLWVLNLEGRRSQILILSAIGIPQRFIKRLMLTEGLFISLLGSLAGTGLAVLYTGIVFSALNSVWRDIVRTDMMEIVIRAPVLLTGFLISLFVSWVTISLTVWGFLKPGHERPGRLSGKTYSRGMLFTAIFPGILSLCFISWQIFSKESINPLVFFTAGGLMLISWLIWFYHIFSQSVNHRFNSLNIWSLGIRNSFRNKNRSISIISLLAVGTFIVLSTGANRQDVFSSAHQKEGGTGGFSFFSETTVPVYRDLNNKNVRLEEGITEHLSFVQFSRAPGDDASCLNLNRISSPVILGVDPAELEGRFSFVSHTPFLSKDFPWSSLNNPLTGGLVPAIADQTVIKWGLGKHVGDTLTYTDAYGRKLNLLLIGGLANSIFQGNVIIADEYFRKHFPDHTGSEVFLIDVDDKSIERSETQLNMIFRDYGWDMTTTSLRLAEFNTVENTYLSIFLLMGALAVLIGTVGLSVILARSILERKQEIALLNAFGIGRSRILNLIMSEYLGLLLAGIFTGVFTSAISTLPSLLSPHTGVSFSSVFLFTALLVLNGVFWIWFMARLFMKDRSIAVALRYE